MFDFISDWAPEIADFFVPGSGEVLEGLDLGMDALGGLGDAIGGAEFAEASSVAVPSAPVVPLDDPAQIAELGHATMFDFLEGDVTGVTGGSDVNIADGFGDGGQVVVDNTNMGTDMGGGTLPTGGSSGVGSVWDSLITDSGLPVGGAGVPQQGGGGMVQTSIGGRAMGGVAAALGIARAGVARLMLTVNGVRTAVSTSTIWKWVQNNPAAMTVVAGAAGITVDQLARVLIANPRRRTRRRRGISPRDLTTTRRTMRRVMTMSRSLSELCHHSPFTRRKR